MKLTEAGACPGEAMTESEALRLGRSRLTSFSYNARPPAEELYRGLAAYLGVTVEELNTYPPQCRMFPALAIEERDRRAAAGTWRDKPPML